MSPRYFTLPDGKSTTDAVELETEWEAFYAPLEKALGVSVAGFDPGLSLRDDASGTAVQIPVWLARRIREIVCAEEGRRP